MSQIKLLGKMPQMPVSQSILILPQALPLLEIGQLMNSFPLLHILMPGLEDLKIQTKLGHGQMEASGQGMATGIIIFTYP